MQLKPIDQQVVVMVGASSGIGRDAALDAPIEEPKWLCRLETRKG